MTSGTKMLVIRHERQRTDNSFCVYDDDDDDDLNDKLTCWQNDVKQKVYVVVVHISWPVGREMIIILAIPLQFRFLCNTVLVTL